MLGSPLPLARDSIAHAFNEVACGPVSRPHSELKSYARYSGALPGGQCPPGMDIQYTIGAEGRLPRTSPIRPRMHEYALRKPILHGLAWPISATPGKP